MNNFYKLFAKRSLICFFIIMCMFLSCVLRVAVVATGNYAKAQAKQSSVVISNGNIRGTIFDCNQIPITNNKEKILAAVSPTPRAVTAISSVLSGEALKSVLERLKQGKPVICQVPEKIDCDGISCTVAYEHESENTPAIHIVGGCNSDGHGISGLEAAYDDVLFTNKELKFIYTCDGKGKILEGIKPEIENDVSTISSGVISTIDINVQNIAESAAESLETGAIVISDCSTNKIRAMVSKPSFDCTNIASYLKSDDSPLLNRALACYNVGSVFKPCVAIAGIESGKNNFTYTCTGSCKIADRIFKCHNHSGHGLVNLQQALAFSCNTFFYNFAILIGGDDIYKTASSLGFGQSLKICDSIATAKGTLPTAESLKNPAFLANFSIGQGELLTSPVSMLNLYSSIATDGKYYIPSIIEGKLKDGNLEKYNIGKKTKVMQPSTAEMLRTFLKSVIDEGTGTSAQPETISAAGKTATAQTGKYEENTEISEGWFCGFLPYEEPKYTVIVFSQNVNRQQKNCGEIFAEIADKIEELYKF